MKIIRGRLNPADVSNPSLRYNATCDCIQYTPDGGSTWVDAPEADPRHSATFLKPPVAGSNKRCDSAANMVKWLKDFIDALNDAFVFGGTVTTFINLAIQFLDILAPYAELLAPIVELAGAIFGIGHAALSGAFTSTEYDALECIFYCHDDPDGQVTASQLVSIESDITAQLNTTAALVVNAILFVQGEVGLSNAGSVGSETGDCSACTACFFAYKWDFRITDGLFVFDSEAGLTGGVYIGGGAHGYEKSATGTLPPYDCGRKSPSFDIPSGCHINTLAIEMDAQAGGGNAHIEAYIGSSRSAGLGQNPHIYAGSWSTSATAFGDISNQSGVHVTFQFANDDGTGDFYSIRIDWTGDAPIGLSGGSYV